MADKILFTAKSKLNAGGDISWKYLTVTNSATRGSDSHRSLDILALVPEISLYEDIFSPTMHGEMAVVDTHNLINDFPFVGMETVYIGFTTPATDNVIQKVFKIYKVSDREINGNKQTYKLHFISVDAWADLRYSENRAFKGTSGTCIKQALDSLHKWDDYYTVTKQTPPTYEGIDVNQINEVKLVSPQWSTFDCIKWLEKAALNKNHYADYLFYESNQGYRFKSLSDMFKQSPIDILKYDHSQSGSNVSNQLMKIHDVRFPQVSDNLTRFLNRAYGQTVYSSDIFKKKIVAKVWDWQKTVEYNMNSTPSDTFPILPDAPNFNLAPDHNVAVSFINTFTHDLKLDTEDESMLTRVPALNFTQIQKMDIDIWGRSWIEVGNTISVILGKYTQHKNDLLNGDDLKNSTTWLVTAIHHRLSPNQHKMTLQLVRNSALNVYEPMTT